MQYYDPDLVFEVEIRREQRRRNHVFVRKLRRRRGAKETLPTPETSNIGIDTFGEVLSAAEFAAAFDVFLDVMVTLDFGRMGCTTEKQAGDEVRRFIKCYTEWATRGQWKLPTAWIYAIECGRGGYHAHVALFVPGLAGFSKQAEPAVNFRKEFRRWCRGYTLRNFKRDIPRAVRPKFNRDDSLVAHWRNVSYLLKGYDRFDLIQTSRNSPDGRAVYLGDLIANQYANPGVVDGGRRVRICHSLGPKQRRFGAPVGLEYRLPSRPDWTDFEVSRTKPFTFIDRLNAQPGIPIPMPFQSRWEAGFRDVRDLYPADFYQLVTLQAPYEPRSVASDVGETLACQLAAMADDTE